MSDRDELAALRRMAELEDKERATVSPTGGFLDNLAAGAGKAVADAGRGIALRSGQMLANAPDSLPLLKGLNVALTKLGMAPSDVVSDQKANITESKKLDAPLMNTGGGVTGNIAGNALMLAPTAGANTPLAAGMVGAGAGAIQPTTDTREGVVNTLLGGVAGAGGQYLANRVPQLLQGRIDKAAAAQAGNAQKFDVARTAAKEGYVIPPADLEPGMVSEAVSGLSGKIKTAQVASQRNQQVTDTLARKALGLKAGDELTNDTLQAIRQKAATEGYAPIRNAGTVTADKQFLKALDDIAATNQGAARSFPGLGENGVADLVSKLKQNSFDAGDAIDATKVLRAAADKAYSQGDKTLGKASKSAADALEDMLDRHLTASGNAEALAAFRDARKLIAKTYSVQKGLNPQTGNVAAPKLAEQLAKGRPLSDELKLIAQTAQAFPKANQLLKEAPKAVSPLDFAVGGIGAANGNILPGLLMGARPVARNMLLSGPVQARALQQSSPVPLTQATQKVLENRLARLMLGPVGTATALDIGQ